MLYMFCLLVECCIDFIFDYTYFEQSVAVDTCMIMLSDANLRFNNESANIKLFFEEVRGR